MKKILLYTLAVFLIGVTTVQATPVSWDFTANVLTPIKNAWTGEVKVPYINATSTATSTFAGSLSVTGQTRTGFVTTTSTATSTFAGPINLGTNHIVTHGVWSDASDGLHIHAGNGTNVGLFGAGNTANSLFYGGVNIDGATRLATSLTGFLKATAGAVSTALVNLASDVTGILGISNGGTGTSTTPSTDAILVGNNSGIYEYRKIAAGTNVTVSTSTPGQIIISSSAAGGSGTGVASGTPFTIGQLTYVSGVNSINSIATTTLTANGGLTLSGSPVIVGATPLTITGTTYLSSSTGYTVGGAAFATANGSISTIATGTITDTVAGLSFTDQTRSLLGGSTILGLDTGYSIPLSNSLLTANSSTTGNLAFWSGNQTIGNVATGTLTTTATGTQLSATRALIGGSSIFSWQTGYDAVLAASTTQWKGFYDTPSTRIIAGANCSWSGNTFDCSGGGGGGGSLSTTTDIIGIPTTTPELVSYITGDVMFGGSASTSAEFQFDDDGAQLNISSTTNTNATATIESNNNAQAVRIGDDSGVGIEHIFSTVGKIISRVYGSITEWVMDFAKISMTGKLSVATTTYNGATTTDALVIDGFTNSGEWLEEFCTSPAAETTQIAADTLRGCNRYTYIEDVNGVLDFVTPTTGTSSYFRLRPGATGVTTAAGDGMGIGWASGIDFGDIQKNKPVMEWTMRQDAMTSATSTFVFAGITDAITVSANYAAEPAQGFYVIATSTPNWLFACNPSTGGTTYVNTGIASSTSIVATNNKFVHFRMEIGGTSNTAVTAILKARTVTNQVLTEVGSCNINLSASTQAVAPSIGIGKSTTGSSPELHFTYLKFWYKQPVF